MKKERIGELLRWYMREHKRWIWLVILLGVIYGRSGGVWNGTWCDLSSGYECVMVLEVLQKAPEENGIDTRN